jgi:acylphosphatase
MKKHFNLTVIAESNTPGFRFSVMEKAYKYEVSGYIRRKHNGGFFIEAEGDETNLEGFVEWCRKGPLGTIIQRIDIEESNVKDLEGFEIKHR